MVFLSCGIMPTDAAKEGREPDEVAEYDERRTTDGFPRSSNGVGELELFWSCWDVSKFNPGAPERQPEPPVAPPVRSYPARRITVSRLPAASASIFCFHSPIAMPGLVTDTASGNSVRVSVFPRRRNNVRGEYRHALSSSMIKLCTPLEKPRVTPRQAR